MCERDKTFARNEPKGESRQNGSGDTSATQGAGMFECLAHPLACDWALESLRQL